MVDTVLTPPEHEHSAALDEAIAYLRSVPPAERPTPLVPALKAMFGISSLEAAEAIRQSRHGEIQ